VPSVICRPWYMYSPNLGDRCSFSALKHKNLGVRIEHVGERPDPTEHRQPCPTGGHINMWRTLWCNRRDATLAICMSLSVVFSINTVSSPMVPSSAFATTLPHIYTG